MIHICSCRVNKIFKNYVGILTLTFPLESPVARYWPSGLKRRQSYSDTSSGFSYRSLITLMPLSEIGSKIFGRKSPDSLACLDVEDVYCTETGSASQIFPIHAKGCCDCALMSQLVYQIELQNGLRSLIEFDVPSGTPDYFSAVVVFSELIEFRRVCRVV